MNQAADVLLQYGAIGVMLVFLGWLHLRSMKAGEKREEVLQVQLTANRQECRDDSAKLTGRIEKLEDHSRTTLGQIATTSAEALKDTAAAMRRFAEADTERITKRP